MTKMGSLNKRKGTGLAVGLLIGVLFAVFTGKNALFVLGIAIGAALETTYNT